MTYRDTQDGRGTLRGAPSGGFGWRLRGRVGVGPAEDVGVPERAGAHLLHGRGDRLRLLGHLVVDGVLYTPRFLRLGHRPAGRHRLVVERLTGGVDGRAVGEIAGAA